MSQHTVSVLMAVHNGRPYLNEAIESILAQTFTDFEFIIIDDGSTDGSAEDIARYAERDGHIRCVHQKQRGLANALNVGLAMAHGRYIARMDADDVAYPGRLAAQIERMACESNLVLVSTAFDYIDSQGRFLKRQIVNTDNAVLRRRLIEDGNQFCHPSVMMRLDAACNVGGYRTLAGNYAQDYDLWLRLSEVGTIANLEQPLLAYRIHDRQISIVNIFLQRRSAEIYKALARQRKTTGIEDIEAAQAEIANLWRSLKNVVASDCLHWADMFYLMGNVKRARAMRVKAIWNAPFSPQVRQLICHLFHKQLIKYREGQSSGKD